MADYKRVNFTESEPIAGAMYPVSDSLDSEAVGVTIVRYVPASQADNAFFLTIAPSPPAPSHAHRDRRRLVSTRWFCRLSWFEPACVSDHRNV